MRFLPAGVSAKRFFADLNHEIQDDNVYNGAAALAYFLTLAIFPAVIFLLTLLPYLPIPHLDSAIFDLLQQAMPKKTADVFLDVVRNIMSEKKGGLLSFGLLATIWAASNGTYAIMQQLNITYDVKEGRSFLKTRLTAVLLTLGLGVLMLGAFGLIVLGGEIQKWLEGAVGGSEALLVAFAVFRWAVVAAAILLAFALTYYFGPDVEQRFRFITPGSIAGAVTFIAATLGLRLYVTNFSNYDAMYGSLGAVVVLMLWLYLTGLVLLLGSEVNALFEHYSPEGKSKGEKVERAAA